ncbi:MAG: N-acetyl-gamma-glutamyl-phosphate reductase [Kofleriaceae bacterium]|nr:N-acetyl-gamma-glutamyl-phosphate reductase [Kofleriaceae bacterium]
MTKLRIAVVGCSGYTGAELLRLLLLHPRVEIVSISAGRAAGKNIADVYPQFRGLLDLDIVEFEAGKVAAEADFAFCALPHAQSARVVAALRQREIKVVDLSADFRLHEQEVYEQWYGTEAEPIHPAPELLSEAVYGLPELHRAAIQGASLVAAPGCYPTSAILALAPLLKVGWIEPLCIIDSKSGVSGAGRNPSLAAHFPEIGEGVRAYKVCGQHRHTPEMEQEMSAIAGADVRVSFTPHLVPMSRGILTCAYARPVGATRSAEDYQRLYEDFYQDEAFVSVLPAGKFPDTAHVRGSNRAHVSISLDERVGQLLAISAIDNLCKGSSGQAIQCMNLMQGWDESLSVSGAASFP